MDKFQKLSPFKAAVVAPIKEELLFRGMLLPLIELYAF
jgi:membrane protease YdiL (CAAX protease family)